MTSPKLPDVSRSREDRTEKLDAVWQVLSDTVLASFLFFLLHFVHAASIRHVNDVRDLICLNNLAQLFFVLDLTQFLTSENVSHGR